MIWFGIDCSVQIFWFALFFYFFILLFYPIYRGYLFSKNLIIMCSLSLASILIIYAQLYSYIVDRELSLILIAINIAASLPLPDVAICFELNSLTYLFSLLVFAIGLFTNIYTLNYFKFEADDLGFIFWLNSFIASMVLLVLAGNFFTLFLGWELIGLTSFFLINFWGVRRATLKASFKAFSFNLFSDLFLLTALTSLYSIFQTSSIIELSGLYLANEDLKNSSLKIPAYALLLCASIKSVQILGHLWLPDSMEAPVPASSLIHSATLVSAGLFLLIRFNSILIEADVLEIVTVVGAITAAYGAVVSAAQTDVKKLLAYSTMSHCGFLFVTIGLGDARVTFVYLFLHGLFKAGTFFCVGSFIRLFGTQDTRLMGAAAKLYWGDSALLLLCSSNLCGLPLAIGATYKSYFFKLLLGSNFNIMCLGFLLLATLFSLIYFYRLIYYCLFDFWKHLWMTSPIYLEVIKPKSKQDYRIRLFKDYYCDSKFTTFAHWTATTLLLFFSFLVYKAVLFNFYNTASDTTILTLYQPTSNFILDCSSYLFRFYLIYFYSLYLIIFVLVYIITWRSQSNYMNKLITIIYLVLLATSGYFLICGAQF